MKKKIILGFLFIIFCIWVVWANSALELNTYHLEFDDLPESFHGYRIVHLSDIHNTKNDQLNEIVQKANPNIIVITGDLIDSRNTNINLALEIVDDLIDIAPCYYVNGNHEARKSDYVQLKEGLLKLGVIVLENEKMDIVHEHEQISILGVQDPSFDTDYLFGDSISVLQSKLEFLVDEHAFQILLSHRPELFDVYVQKELDLVFSGHAHGGQFRLPFVGGLVAPNQGLFPKYDSGIYIEKDTKMIVSRGIGNSILPIRLNNRPEVILIELEKK